MTIYWEIVFFLVNLITHDCYSDEVNPNKELILSEPIDEFILCRGCGREVTDSHDLLHKLSPGSQFAFNETLFKREKVLIQLLSNKLPFRFAVITSSKANCEGIGEWQWENSWFPDYVWRPCLCPECGAHVGWVFEPLDSFTSQRFFGLVLTHLIGETCKYNISDI